MKRTKTLMRPMECVYCGKKLNIFNTHIDHIVPRHRGGSDTPENKLPICATCNLQKHDKPPIKFLRELLRKNGAKLDWGLEEPLLASPSSSYPTVKIFGEDWYFYKVGQQWYMRLFRRTNKSIELLMDANLQFLAIVAQWDKTERKGLIDSLERELIKGMANVPTPFMNKSPEKTVGGKGALL